MELWSSIRLVINKKRGYTFGMITSHTAASDTRLPIYQRLKDDFVRRITQGVWTPGAPISSETQLAAELGVSTGTVRKAIEDLVQDGFLFRTQGKGTFVRRADFGNALSRFFRHTDSTGTPLRPHAQMLRIEEVSGRPQISQLLGLDPSAPLLKLRRLRLIGDMPKLYEEIFVSKDKFGSLAALPLDAFGDLLYPLYEEVCGHRIFRATETIRFDKASAQAAKYLGTTRGEAVAVIERLAVGFDGQPLEWRCSVGLASQFAYSVELR
jgi:GntR family transcriptional regulator